MSPDLVGGALAGSRDSRRPHRDAIIDPGKPWQSGTNESFNGKFRGECLSVERFRTRREAHVIIEASRRHFNAVRPHSSLGYVTPFEFKQHHPSRTPSHFPEMIGSRLRATVRAQVGRRALRTHQARQYVSDSPGADAPGHVDRQTLVGEFVDHREAFELLAVGAGIEDKVVGPDMVGRSGLHVVDRQPQAITDSRSWRPEQPTGAALRQAAIAQVATCSRSARGLAIFSVHLAHQITTDVRSASGRSQPSARGQIDSCASAPRYRRWSWMSLEAGGKRGPKSRKIKAGPAGRRRRAPAALVTGAD